MEKFEWEIVYLYCPGKFSTIGMDRQIICIIYFFVGLKSWIRGNEIENLEFCCHHYFYAYSFFNGARSNTSS